MTEGKLQEKARDIANHTPLGILDDLHKKHDVWLPDQFLTIIEKAKADFPLVIPGWIHSEGGKVTHGSDYKSRWVEPKEALKWFEKYFGEREEDYRG